MISTNMNITNFTKKSVLKTFLKATVLTALLSIFVANESSNVFVEACCSCGSSGEHKTPRYCFIIPMPCLDDEPECNDFTVTICGTFVLVATVFIGNCCFGCGSSSGNSSTTKPQKTGAPIPNGQNAGKQTQKKKESDHTTIFVVIGVVVLLGVGAYFFMSDDDEEEEELEHVRW